MSSIDLRALFKSVGGLRPQFASADPAERGEVDIAVEMFDEAACRVRAAPLDVAGFVDGIQSTMLVTHREHRPVHLTYVAAGALAPGGKVLGLRERLSLVCGADDGDWARALDGGVDVEEVAGDTPPAVEMASAHLLGAVREHLERDLVEGLVMQNVGTLVLDGSIMRRPALAPLVGVVKTTRSRYLDDESVLWGLRAGWRSPRFRVPGKLNAPDRYSCYVRMVDATDHGWSFGLIRLEAFDPELLEPLAARCLAERQGSASRDGRWDRHLASIAAVEKFLRARRPPVFGMLG